MSVEDCARLVHQGDPARFAATMAAPAPLRPALWPLYALNLEIARAPWAAREPVVAEMRLQWWIDTITELAGGGERRGHPVTEALAPLIARDPGLAPLLTAIGEARRWDCWAEPFADRGQFDAYLDATSGNLMWAAARALGAPAAAEAPIRDFAWGAGLAAWLVAAPALEARGRIPFVDGRPAGLAGLAAEGRARIARARSTGGAIPRHVRPVLWPGAGAARLLALAGKDPARIAAGTLAASPFRARAGLLAVALTGRF